MGALRRRARGERGAPRLRSRRARARDERRGQVPDDGPGHRVERPLAPSRNQRGTHAQQTAASRLADRAERMADGGRVAADGSGPLVSRSTGSGGGDVLDRAARVWRRGRARGWIDRRNDGRRVRDGALAWNRAIEPLGAALTILLPWSLLLPFAVRWAARRWKTHAAAGERLALIWSITFFVVVAASSRQRWRYYLPLCVPGSLLIAGWLWSRGVWRQMAISVTAWVVVASTLVFGEVYVTARDNRGTELRTIARALQREPAPLFALEAPELVFSFYLRRSIPVVSSTAELRGVDPPVYVIARDPPAPEAFDPVAQGFVKGRPFVLWSKQ